MTPNRLILVTSLALFAMFFGAGNLIIPVMIGVEAGHLSWIAAVGFICSGVLLPAMSMVALASKRKEEKRLADRLGAPVGLVLTTAIFLSCGMIYGIPRVGAVSFEFVVAPLVNDSQWALAIYLFAFFAVSYTLARRPAKMVRHIGMVLTPTLLVLLAALVIASFTVPVINTEASPQFSSSPVAGGFIQGYFTMDALAALVFGGVIVASFAAAGHADRQLQKSTALAGVTAGLLLSVVYLGLIRVGLVGSGSNGAEVISGVAHQIFGRSGQMLFGAIVVLACLTTTLGLIAAFVHYFHELVPNVSAHAWLVICVSVSFALANLGLERILAVVAPLNQLLYPMVICLIVVSLVDLVVPIRLLWSYRASAWIAGVLAVVESLYTTGISLFMPVREWLNLLPMGQLHMAWVVPALVGLFVGVGMDYANRNGHSNRANPGDKFVTA
ncbi:branched-chain amino acid transport system II carrier protein [Arcanobacterium phocae]|uniref:branched-chain amino acid transport system II carrier protein n=1 Tax=Arcanobacterium phocae TaxID=131112 RepID=UPI001C0F1A43|nr:branched-chain amino acid transport system II carrier protein [Arcanobacterium phocae]